MAAEALGVRTSAPGESAGDAALGAWSCRAPSLAPDRGAVAYVSDRDGVPRVWVRPLRRGGRARPVATGPEPVAEVSWSPSGERLAVLLTPGGGEHTQVWTVRPDGGDLRPLVAPEGGSAWFVRWTGRGDLLLAAEVAASGTAEALLVDAATGGRETVARGPLLHPEAVSRDHARVLLQRRPRGVRRMYVRELTPEATGPGGERPLLAELPGSTDYGVLSPGGETAYLLSDAGRGRAGVDVCGIADFATFYERTEPWITAAAVSEYGHPEADRDLLHALSPLHAFDRLATPLLVVHGARDTNVPVYEAEQVVRAARAREVPCEILLFEDEGHEIRRRANRVTFVRRVTDWLDRHLTGVFPG
ncbi:prolyl oligopeptidase family serine peptidase [Microbispora sp. NBC_01189]|uniref:S9 family peptidase n=1 Tax=Microbispora sp. NBC_01189 TaxID=2903583 RepID=UPI002E0FFE4E|nr:prolyl oligopeptidase family serine peptidase [Microbispora sp. NBC_01189]